MMSNENPPPDPVFCRCGAPANAVQIPGTCLYSCHYGKRCKFRLGSRGGTVAEQQRRALEWVQDPGQKFDRGPGVDVRVMFDDKQVLVAVRPLAPSRVLIDALHRLGGQTKELTFTNSIGFGVPGSTAPPPKTTFFVFPYAQYNDLLVGLRQAGIAPSRTYRPPSYVHAAVERMRQIDEMPAVELGDEPIFSKLMPYQRDGVGAAILRNGRLMIADEMGLGKTVQALAIAYYYRTEGRVLILCPASLCSNWEREVRQWWSMPSTRIAIVRGQKDFASMRGADIRVVICSYNACPAVTEFEGVPLSTLIMDESHLIKNADTKRTIAALALARLAPHVLLLTGTPTLARPIELFTQLSALLGGPTGDNGSLPTRRIFAERYCCWFFSVHGPHESGFNRLEELSVLMRPLMIRRKKRDVLSQLPEKQKSIIYLSLTDEDRKRYLQALKTNGGFDVTRPTSPSSLALYVSTANAKLQPVKEYVESVIAGIDFDDADDPRPQKVLFFGFHKVMIEAICKCITEEGRDFVRIDGETPSHKRSELVEHFQTKPSCRFAVLSIGAAGTGWNFTAANLVVFCELDYTPSNLLQCEDRIHRYGQTKECMIRYLVAQGTTDEAILAMLQEKTEVNSALLSESALAGGVNTATIASERQVRQGDAANAASPPPAPKQHQAVLDSWLGRGKKTTTMADIIMADAARSGGGNTTTVDDDDDVVEIVQAHRAIVPAVSRGTVVYGAPTPVVASPPPTAAASTVIGGGGGAGPLVTPAPVITPVPPSVPAPLPKRTLFVPSGGSSSSIPPSPSLAPPPPLPTPPPASPHGVELPTLGNAVPDQLAERGNKRERPPLTTPPLGMPTNACPLPRRTLFVPSVGPRPPQPPAESLAGG